MLLGNIAAAVNALFLSVKYASDLNIHRTEWIRYVKKSISLALCYADLGIEKSLMETWRAGEAAFFCCAYDVVTDWRRFDWQARRRFESILRFRVSQCQFDLAMGLYEKERHNLLAEDGLERGPIALRFALQIMRCMGKQERIWGDLDNIGRLLQIVDDVLDYEQDLAGGEMNCLTSEKGRTYLEDLLLHLRDSDTRRLFGGGRSVLTIVIRQARKKATLLLQKEPPFYKVIRLTHDA